FENKEDLWREVKANIIATTLEDANLQEAPPIQTVDELLDHLVWQRYRLYSQNKDLLRMLMWQSLEDQGASLTGTSEKWLKSWIDTIVTLQKKKVINNTYTPHEIIMLFHGIVWGPFITRANIEFDKKGTAFIKKMMKTL